MSCHNVPTDVLLIPSNEMWMAWCPNIDVTTQGDNPEHAIGMAHDVIRLMFEEDLMGFRWNDPDPEGLSERERVRKRVFHPLRRGRFAHVRSDEHWPLYEQFVNRKGVWAQRTHLQLGSLTEVFGPSIVMGNTTVSSRGGIVQAIPSLGDWAFVPARIFEYKSRRIQETSHAVVVPSAILDRSAPLRRSGMSVYGVVLGWIGQMDPSLDSEVQVWSIKERSQGDPDGA